MAEMSRRFNFDDFDEQIREALEGNDEAMAGVPRRPRPGEIGGVVVQLSFADRLSDHPRLFDPDTDPLPEPPEAA